MLSLSGHCAAAGRSADEPQHWRVPRLSLPVCLCALVAGRSTPEAMSELRFRLPVGVHGMHASRF